MRVKIFRKLRIKHKGGVDYKFVEPKDPYELFIQELPENGGKMHKIENFSPAEKIDIDEKLDELKKVHIALYQCIDEVVSTIDYKSHALF